jgi:hypothetical protein
MWTPVLQCHLQELSSGFCSLQNHQSCVNCVASQWDRESALMAEVYGNATVNIAASAAQDGTFGLFGERNGSMPERKYFKTSKGVLYELMPHNISKNFLVGTPLSKRAWAFQERYLAQRTLHFTADQVFGECRQHIACEVWPNGVPMSRMDPLNPPKFPDRQGSEGWSRTVYHYLEGQLTYPKDIFVALSGVAQQFQKRLQDRYVAGLWMKQLPWQLCWRSKLSSKSSYQPALNMPYRAPSWSWASNYAPVTWQLYTTNDVTNTSEYTKSSVVEILDVVLIPLGRDPFGQVQDANLQLKCGTIIKYSAFQSLVQDKKPHTRVADDHMKHWCGYVSYDQGVPSATFAEASYLLPLLKDGTDYQRQEEMGVLGLIIAPSSKSAKGEFLRIGVFDIVLRPFESFRECMQFFSSQPNMVMEGSLYEQSLGPDADGLIQYTIRLI